jgi:hypothetical protein
MKRTIVNVKEDEKGIADQARNDSFRMKHFTTLFVLSFLAFPFFSSCQLTRNGIIEGNHNLVNQRVDIEDYDEIYLDIPAKVYYQQFSDSVPYLQIHTDENIFAALDVKVKGRKLVLSVKNDSTLRPSKLTIYTCSHNLSHARITGSGDLYLKGEVNALNFDLTITGSGSLQSDSLLCESIKAKITGSGDANLIGAGKKSYFSITGSGGINASDYFLLEAECHVTGSGNIKTNVNKKLNANITGSGNISYAGNPPIVESSVTGSGKINKK